MIRRWAASSSRDPLGRSPLFFSDQPYGYAGNNPLVNVDPSGQVLVADGTGGVGGDLGWAQKYPAYKQPLSPNVTLPEV